MPKTKTTSLETLSEALANHGWQFTVEPATIKVPDESRDYSSRYSSRRRLGRKDAPGFVVKIANKVGIADHLSYGDDISASLYFTEEGAYVAEMTKGSYPISKASPLKTVLEVVANQSPAEIQRKRDWRKERAKQSAAEDIAKADAKVAEARAAAQDARYDAVMRLAQITGHSRDTAARILDALASEVGQPINAYVGLDWEARKAEERAQYARDQYLAGEKRGWTW